MRTRVTLRRGSWERHAIVEVPARTCQPYEIVQALHQLADTISVANAVDESCGPACGSCCRQMVPVTIPEIGLLQRVVAGQPPERQRQIREATTQAAAALRTQRFGPAEQLCNRSRRDSRVFGQWWFSLGVPCPFLVEESCSIYELRPLICREYLVTSPPSACSRPGCGLIQRTVAPVSIWSRVVRSGPDQPRWLPMSSALTAEVPVTKPVAGPELLARLLSPAGRH